MNNQKTIVFFDVQRGKSKIGRIKIELWNHLLPKTLQNFRQLCTGQYIKQGKPIGYKQSCFYQITQNSIVGGDFVNNNGSGGQSIYSTAFKQALTEPYQIQQGSNWIISMVKNNEQKYSSIFEFSQSWHAKNSPKLCPLGQVVQQNSIKILKSMMESPTSQIQHRPKIPLVIYECGEM